MIGGIFVGHALGGRAEAEGDGVLGGPAPAGSGEAVKEATLRASLTPIVLAQSAPAADTPSLSTDSLRSYGRIAKTSDLRAKEAAEAVRLTSASEETETVKPTRTAKASAARYFIQPASGQNWGILHASNAVDIANSCGTQVVAAAEGVVTEDVNYDQGAWNAGYGNYLMIEHPNGTKTRYAHLEKIKVSVGTVVGRGEAIGTIGNTGKVHGVTGCHLHFEVIGMANAFVKS